MTRYWPFDVGDRQRHTEREKRYVRFLENAYSLGYRPFEISFGMESYGATGSGGRSAEIIYRGRSGWQMVACESERRAVSAFVNDFECAAQAALDWLGGCDDVAVVAHVEGHLVRMPGMAEGHELIVRSAQAAHNPPSR